MHRLFKELKDSVAIPSYFYLNWDKRQAEWRTMDRAPPSKSLKFRSRVKWKELNNMTVELCANYQNPDLDEYTYVDNPYINVSFLKSHLQKCVRRSNVYKTLKTAYHLMDIDIQEFLRRLAVIAVEDSLPYNGFTTLIWFTAAVSKGYKMSESQKCWCLGYCLQIAESKYYEKHGHSDRPFNLIKKKLDNIDRRGLDLLFSMQFRKAYGGRGGDKKMFDYLTGVWYQRFKLSEDNSRNSPDYWINILDCQIKFVTPPENKLELNEWLPAGIDFHCCPQIIGMLMDRHDEFDEQELRSAIWSCSSSVTDKQCINGEIVEISDEDRVVWKKIAKDYIGMAKFFLKVQH